MFTRLEKVCLGACAAGIVTIIVGYGKPLGMYVSPPLFWGGLYACVTSIVRRGYGKEDTDS